MLRHFHVSSRRFAALALLAASPIARGVENWFVHAQTSEPEVFESCPHCSFVTPDGGAILVGRNSYSQGLSIARYAPTGAQLWMYENAGNFNYPQGPQAAAFLDDGSTCVLTQNLLADQSDKHTATRRPSGEGRNQLIERAPAASTRFGSSRTRSLDKSSGSPSTTSTGCSSGGASFSANVSPCATRMPQ